MIFLRRSGIHLTDEYWEVRMRKYVIVGTGGTGGVVGGYLAKAGMDVTFIISQRENSFRRESVVG